MSADIRNVRNNCHPRVKDLCHGFVRCIEFALASGTISVMLYWLVTAFYFSGDYFLECGGDMVLSQLGDTVTKIQHWYPEQINIAMCSQWVYSGAVATAHWTFQLVSPIKDYYSPMSNINFRIFESNTKDTNLTDLDNFIQSTKGATEPIKSQPRWSCFIFNPIHAWHRHYNLQKETWESVGNLLKHGKATPDTIHIILNMQDGLVYCECVDGHFTSEPRLCGTQNTGFGFENYKKGNYYYKMTVAIFSKDIKIKLLNFHTQG